MPFPGSADPIWHPTLFAGGCLKNDSGGLVSCEPGLLAGLRPEGTQTPAFVIGSGKGGVGKSLLSVMWASTLARSGFRVLLFDAAQNQGNLHILLGIVPPTTLEAVLDEHFEVSDLLVPLEERLWLLPTECGAEALQGLTATERARLHHRLTSLYDRFDVVIIDAGSGIETVLRSTIMGATRLVVVAVPEPASLSEAAALIRLIHFQVPSLPIHVVVNRAVSEAEGLAIFDRLRATISAALARDISYFGTILERADIRRLAHHPDDLLALPDIEIAAVARRLAWAEGLTPRVQPDQSHQARHDQ